MKVTRTTIINQIDVIGYIWMPNVVCAMSYNPSESDVENDEGNVDFDSIQAWIDTHTGDFAEIIDWRATIGDGTFDSEFTLEDSEFTFMDCMYPEED